MGLLGYDNNGVIQAIVQGDGTGPMGGIPNSLTKFYFDETLNPGVFEIISQRKSDFKIVGGLLKLLDKEFPVVGRDVEQQALDFSNNVTADITLLSAGITQWKTFTTDAQKSAFVVANFDKVMTILERVETCLSWLLKTYLKINRLF